MPTYEYLCRACGTRLEVVQSFSDDALTVCDDCGGELRKVFSAAGLIFKGSGWHIKDYSGSGAPSTPSSSDGKQAGGAKPSEGGGSSKDGSSKDSGGSSSGSSKDSSKDSSSKDGAAAKPAPSSPTRSGGSSTSD